MKKWKYAKDKAPWTSKFLKIKYGVPKEVFITDWDFTLNPKGYGFKSYVTEEDGEKTDKIWIVWDYEFIQHLKKKIGKKKKHLGVRLKVLLNNEDDVLVHDVKIIK